MGPLSCWYLQGWSKGQLHQTREWKGGRPHTDRDDSSAPRRSVPQGAGHDMAAPSPRPPRAVLACGRTTRWRPPLADLCTKPGGGAAAVKQHRFFPIPSCRKPVNGSGEGPGGGVGDTSL